MVRPRPPTATSIPGLLAMLQNEWDAIVLESFQLRDAHHKIREELTTALYENDAAKRVIARLIRERDEAKDAMKNVKAMVGGMATADGATGNEMEVDEQEEAVASEPLPDDVMAKMDARQQE